IAYNASTGAVAWAQRYNGRGNGDDDARAIAVSPDGTKVFVTGNSFGGGTNDDYVTWAYRATTGAHLWARRYASPGNNGDEAKAIAVSPGGSSVFVTGYSFQSASGADFLTYAYRASNGAGVWVRRSNGPGNSTDAADAIAVDNNGVYVTGSTRNGS